MIAIQNKQPPKFSKTLGELLITISVITGWKLNKNPAALETLCTQLSLKLSEDFPGITTPQIEDAFRKYGTDEQDFGKTINVALVARVMQRYFSNLGQEQDYAERSNKLPFTVTPKPSRWQDLQDTRAMLESKYQLFLEDRLQFDLLPGFAFKTLQKDFGIVPELPQRFVEQAKKILAAQGGEADKQHRDAVAIAPLLSLMTPEKTLDELCKRLAIEYAFNRFAGLNMPHIYEPMNHVS
jgi:hypothetical protein